MCALLSLAVFPLPRFILQVASRLRDSALQPVTLTCLHFKVRAPRVLPFPAWLSSEQFRNFSSDDINHINLICLSLMLKI